MPGLINKENRSALPLSVSDITSCVRGYTLAMTASLTYENIEDHAIEGEDQRERLKFCCKTQEQLFVCCPWLLSTCLPFPLLLVGIFIYPLEENSIVVGFESMISSQIITLQIKDKSKIEDCFLDCCHSSDGVLQGVNGKRGSHLLPLGSDCCLTPVTSLKNGMKGWSESRCWLLMRTFAGHIVMDEDLERMVLVVNLGVIPPMETVHVLVSTSSELCTLPSGGISVSSPPACTPRVQRTINEEQGLSPNFSRT